VIGRGDRERGYGEGIGRGDVLSLGL